MNDINPLKLPLIFMGGLLLSCGVPETMGLTSTSPKDLFSENPSKRRRAAISAGEQKNKDAIRFLILRLIGNPEEGISPDPVPIVRAQCATALGQIGVLNDRVKSALKFSIQNDSNPVVQTEVIHAIRKLTFQEARPLVEEKFTHSSSIDVRHASSDALKEIGTKDSVPVIIPGLDNEHYRIRKASHAALKNITGKDGPMKKDWWENWLSAN